MSEQKPQYITDALELIGMTETKQITQEVSGFVPVFEALLEKYDDHITALVFGRRWQFCRMKDGVCNASLERIASDLKISAATVMRHTEKLVADGYLIDLTPDLRNVPHSYADAGLVVMKSQLTVSQGNTSISERNATVSQGNTSISESQLIKVNKESNKVKKEKKTAAPKPPTPEEIKLYHSVVKRYPNTEVYPVVVAAIQKVSARLARDCTAEDLQPFFNAWLTKSANRANFSVWLEEWAVNGSVLQQYGKQKQTNTTPAPVELSADKLTELKEKALKMFFPDQNEVTA